MTNDKLPEEIQEQIKADAQIAIEALNEELVKTSTSYSRRIDHLSDFNEGYVFGATAWAPWKMKCEELSLDWYILQKEHQQLKEQAHRLADTFEELIALKYLKDGHGKTKEYLERQPSAWTKAIVSLQQFKDGKEVGHKVYRPCPHCGMELFRDRNLCCRACGTEVKDEVCTCDNIQLAAHGECWGCPGKHTKLNNPTK